MHPHAAPHCFACVSMDAPTQKVHSHACGACDPDLSHPPMFCVRMRSHACTCMRMHVICITFERDCMFCISYRSMLFLRLITVIQTVQGVPQLRSTPLAVVLSNLGNCGFFHSKENKNLD